MPVVYPYVITGFLLMCGIGLMTANRRVHNVLCVAWLLLTLGYLFFSSLERIAAHFT